MGELLEFKYRIKRFFEFTPREIKELAITILLITFVFAYDDKQPIFQLSHWLINYLKVFIMVFCAFIAHVGAQKLSGLWIGMKAEYRYWPAGLVISVILTLVTGGKWYIVLPGGMLLHLMTIQRLGHFRYGLNMFSYGMISTMGPFANLLLATFTKTLALLGVYPGFFEFMTFINLYYAVWSYLPLPKLDGIHMFFGGRAHYVFFFGILLGYILLYVVGFYSLIFALIIGAVVWGIYLYTFEVTTR